MAPLIVGLIRVVPATVTVMRPPKNDSICEQIVKKIRYLFDDCFFLLFVAIRVIEIVFRKMSVGEIASHNSEFVTIVVDLDVTNFEVDRGEDRACIWRFSLMQSAIWKASLKHW